MPVDDVPADSLPKSRTVVLVVAERARRDGKYSAHHNGRLVVGNTRTPFLDGARTLLAQGLDPNARYVMRRSPDGLDDLVSMLGQAAKLMVDESSGAPRFRRWAPNLFRGPAGVVPALTERVLEAGGQEAPDQGYPSHPMGPAALPGQAAPLPIGPTGPAG